MNNFVKDTFSKFIIFKVKSTFEQICSNAFKNEFQQFHSFIIFNVNIFFKFEKEWHTFNKKTIVIVVLKNKIQLFYYAPLVIFQKYKITISSNFDTPCDFFLLCLHPFVMLQWN
jgi:hypothetical protein